MALIFNTQVEDVIGNTISSGAYIRFDFFSSMDGTFIQFTPAVFKSQSDFSNSKMPTKLLYTTNASPSKTLPLPRAFRVATTLSQEETLDWTNVHNALIAALQQYYPSGSWTVVS